MISMDVSVTSLIAALIIAIVLLALILLFGVSILRQQAQIMQKQTLLLRASVYPLLELETLPTHANMLTIALTNKGTGPAFHIGLFTRFIPLHPQEDSFDFVSALNDPTTNKRAYPSDMVVFLKGSHGDSTLHPGNQDEFKAEISFWLSPFERASQYPWLDLVRGKTVYAGRACSFDDLKGLLSKNSVRYVALLTSLVYMDITETIVETERINYIVADLNKHETYEGALKDGVNFRQVNLSPEQIASLPWDVYKNRKSHRAFLDGHP